MAVLISVAVAPGFSVGADGGATGNIADYASLTPVDPPTRCDDRLGLSACSKTQQKGGQPKEVFASHKPKCRNEVPVRTCASARAQASGGPQVTGESQN